jgi:hypothetical protein
MSPRTARLSAVPFVVLAFLIHLAADLWVQPLTWDVKPVALWVLVTMSVFVVTLGVPLGAYWLLISRVGKRPSTWEADAGQRRFTAGPSPAGAGLSAVALGWLTGGLVPTERVTGEERMRIAELGAVTPVMTVLAVAGLLVTIWFVVGRWPWLSLDREAVTFKRVVRETRIRWDDLPADLRDLRLPARGLHITPKFLDFSLRTYREDPARREAIGTPAEVAALALAAGPHGE